MAWAKLATKTLTSNGDTITTSTFTGNKFNQILQHTISSGLIETTYNFNADNTGTKYSYRKSTSGGADSTAISQSYLFGAYIGWTYAKDEFIVGYLCSISGEEKLGIFFAVGEGTQNATVAPERIEIVGKYVPSPDASITSVTSNNGNTGDFVTDSNLSVLGTD